MDGLSLLQEASSAGLKVRAEGDRLTIRGPRRAEAVARRLIRHKAEVLAALDPRYANDVPQRPAPARGLRRQAGEFEAHARLCDVSHPRAAAAWRLDAEKRVSWPPAGISRTCPVVWSRFRCGVPVVARPPSGGKMRRRRRMATHWTVSGCRPV